MPERPQYLLDRDAKRRAGVTFSQNDAPRDFARSGLGRNYFAIENLQAQAPSFESGDPRIDELKKRRRTWNRYQKYPAGEILGKTPQQMQNEYMGLSRNLRQTAPQAYGTMYPFSQAAMKLGESGGIWGTMLREIAGKTIKGVKDYASGTGLASILADEPEEDKERYITETFGPHLENVPYGGPPPYEYEGPWPHERSPIDDVPSLIDEESELTRDEQIEKLLVDPGVRSDSELLLEQWENDKQKRIDEEQKRIDDYYGKSEEGEMVFADEPTVYEAPVGPEVVLPPFDEGREDFIREQNEYVSPSSVFPGNVRQDPQDTEKWLRYLTAPELGSADPQGDFASFNEYPTPDIGVEFGETDIPPIIPYDDSVREAGIASLYGQGPQWGETDRRYEDEYRDHIARTGERMTYEEFARAWENVHQGKPHAGLR